MTVMHSYEYYLYEVFKEISRLEKQGYSTSEAYQLARQRYANMHYRPPTPCRARGDRPRPRPELIQSEETLPSRSNDNERT
jgi:hypothetical protein